MGDDTPTDGSDGDAALNPPPGAAATPSPADLLEQLPVGIFAVNGQGAGAYANAAAVELLGKGVVTDTTAHMLADTYGARLAGTADPYPFEQVPLVRALAGETVSVSDMEIVRDDRIIPLRVKAKPMFGDDGRVEFAVAVFDDATSDADAEARYRMIFRSAPIGLCVLGLDGRLQEVNPAMTEITERSETDLLSMRYADILHVDDVSQHRGMIRQLVAGEVSEYCLETRLFRPDGTLRWVNITAALTNGPASVPQMVSQVEDVTDRKRVQVALAERALHDPLTGLANRTLLYDRLKHALDRLLRHPTHVALLYLDLDGFKTVNDAYGHRSGDVALVEVARCLETVIRPQDTAARMGGDEFVILCEDIEVATDARLIADRIEARVAAITPPGARTPLRASVGVAIASRRESADNLLNRADADMYIRKLHSRES